MQPHPDPASPERQEGSPPPPPEPMPTEETQAAPEPDAEEEVKDAPAVEVEPEEAVDRDDEEAKGREEEAKDGDEQEEAEERRGRGRKRGRRPGAPRGLVMVKRELLARCMTCPLCNRLLRDATTVSECLHTFCRKCIYKKFNDEEVESCPVCDIDLGCTPVEKLRADHSLQDVRSKIFPFKRKKIKAEDVASPDSPPNKRKERSISSLVVHTPRLTPTGSTGRRTKVVTRKKLLLPCIALVLPLTVL
uniref:RING-type domain-containing protein n=2 Tax=Aegilops tauschii subsp. strangulata TaxID=200361 RepID=A0A453LQN7_AEGTS